MDHVNLPEQFEQKVQQLEGYFEHLQLPTAYELVEGTGAIMVSAPHAVEQTREGKPKPAEPQTGILALLLHEATDCPVIYSTNSTGDANYDEYHPYKEALIAYLQRTPQVRALIDLHQLSPERDVMVNLGTAAGKNLLGYDDGVRLIKEAFEVRGIAPVLVDTPFKAGGANTVSSSIARICHIPTLQIELNSQLLVKEYAAYRFVEVYGALIHVLALLEEHINA